METSCDPDGVVVDLGCSDNPASECAETVHERSRASGDDVSGGSGDVSRNQDVNYVPFEDTDEFYNEIERRVTDAEDFTFRLPPCDRLEQLPLRLRELLEAVAGGRQEARWLQAFESMSADPGEEDQCFAVYFHRNFDHGSWHDWDEWHGKCRETQQQQPGTAGAIAASVPLANAHSDKIMLELSGHVVYAASWCWAWARGQDRRRWGWIAGCSAATVGCGLATVGSAGTALPITAGMAVGLTTGIMSSGRRKGKAIVSQSGITLECS